MLRSYERQQKYCSEWNITPVLTVRRKYGFQPLVLDAVTTIALGLWEHCALSWGPMTEEAYTPLLRGVKESREKERAE